MNKWECEHPGCKEIAIGTGAAFGLRAIGWFFRPGLGQRFSLLCPAHRPDPIPCRESGENAGKPCSLCRADEVAAELQRLIAGDEWPQHLYPPAPSENVS